MAVVGADGTAAVLVAMVAVVAVPEEQGEEEAQLFLITGPWLITQQVEREETAPPATTVVVAARALVVQVALAPMVTPAVAAD